MTHFFIIGLKDSLILIKQTLISILYPFFPNNNEFTILFLPNTKDNFNKYIEIRNRQIEIDQVFLEEISNFNQKIIIMQKIRVGFGVQIVCKRQIKSYKKRESWGV